MQPTPYEDFIAVSRYARWLPEAGRRETWSETVDRYFQFWEDQLSEFHPQVLPVYRDKREWLQNLVVTREVMPSMRALMTAGEALRRDHVAGYNCAFRACDDLRAFDETMYILMCGTGVGFSVENHYVNRLPQVAESFHKTDTTIVVSDSKVGWASAFRELVAMLYAGKIPKWDMSRVRPAGSPLKTFGGRASGPEPLESLFEFTVRLLRDSAGRRIRPLEAHDLLCKVGEVVVVGGVRRSALISLSDLGDEQMRVAKSGAWWEAQGHRALANNSAVYNNKPDMHTFMKEWQSLMDSRSGERGIFNREACQRIVNRSGRRESNHEFGTNPCSEIILRNKQFCNLSEAVLRERDTDVRMMEKIGAAAVLGTLQATLTDFRFLGKAWKRNCEEERLLGVSLTGIMDSRVYSTISPETRLSLQGWKEEVNKTNADWAHMLGINQAAATTCVKPSGTVSQLVDAASGIHTRHAPYYIRRIRQDKQDPLTQYMVDAGVPAEVDVMNPSAMVLSFPKKAPESALCRDSLSAIQQLELWLMYQQDWCEHKPSITVSVRDHEWLEVADWVYKHFDWMSGVSFLPYDGGTYKQAPYEDITHEEYEKLEAEFPKGLDFSKLGAYESEDQTKGSQELACTAGGCEI